MEKENLEKLYIYDDEESVITEPYYMVTYVDDYLNTHLATVKDEWYLHFLEDRYYIKNCVYIKVDKKEK